jgi:hypothetical protein
MGDWTKFADMELDDEDRYDACLPIAMPENRGPQYPYGLRITLTHVELEKLGLEADCDIGDMIDLRAFAEVTCVSKDSGPAGETCRVELQIQKLAIENEMAEDEDDEEGY